VKVRFGGLADESLECLFKRENMLMKDKRLMYDEKLESEKLKDEARDDERSVCLRWLGVPDPLYMSVAHIV
jgi:hypothetical protein